MEEANVFVQHSITAPNGDQEGLPIVLMEAMAMNMPIISTFHWSLSIVLAILVDVK